MFETSGGARLSEHLAVPWASRLDRDRIAMSTIGEPHIDVADMTSHNGRYLSGIVDPALTLFHQPLPAVRQSFGLQADTVAVKSPR